MFQSTQHLPQRLTPEHYTSLDIHQDELDRMFLPSWHFVGAAPDAPRIGDYFTAEVLKTPLVCWHTSQGFQTFLNVCTHRSCTLTDKRHGQFSGRMKCQYHGWEYDETGNTCKIPDAQHFRPLKKGELGLREIRTEMIGQLIFVTFNQDAPPLKDSLGPQLVAWCEKHFSPRHRRTSRMELFHDCNWKIIVENVIESYHLESVHRRSFGVCPDAAHCHHEFHPAYDFFRHDASNSYWYEQLEQFIARVSQREASNAWEHFLWYPHVIFGGAGAWHYVQIIHPEGPGKCRNVIYTMHDSGPHGRVLNFLLHRLLMRFGSMISAQIQAEDAVVYPAIHRGISSTLRPHGGGLISAREERIFTFQDYVLKSLSNEQDEPVVPMPPPANGGADPAMPAISESRRR